MTYLPAGDIQARSYRQQPGRHGKTMDYINENGKGIIFTNLVDFDMKYGHRNNTEGKGRPRSLTVGFPAF